MITSKQEYSISLTRWPDDTIVQVSVVNHFLRLKSELGINLRTFQKKDFFSMFMFNFNYK